MFGAPGQIDYPNEVPDRGPIYTETLLHAQRDPGGWLVEPYNAASAALFIVVAIYWLTRVSWRTQPFLTYAAWVLCIGGIGGTLYHGLRTQVIFLVLDVLPIMILAISAVYWFVHRMATAPWMAPVYTIGGLAGVMLTVRLLRDVFAGDLRGPVVGYGMLGLYVTVPMLLFGVRSRFEQFHWVVLALISFVAGMTFRALDRSGVLPMGTHFLWHILGAVMTHLLILYLWRMQKVELT